LDKKEKEAKAFFARMDGTLQQVVAALAQMTEAMRQQQQQAQEQATRHAAQQAVVAAQQERLAQRSYDAQVEAARLIAEAAQKREEERRAHEREERDRREAKEEELRQERLKPWLQGVNAEAARSHVLSREARVVRFNQHLVAANRSASAILAEMYSIFGSAEDRAFLEQATHLEYEDLCRAHNARLVKARLNIDPNDAWASDWGPFVRMACPILFREAEQQCPAAAEFNRSLLANRRAAHQDQVPDPTGGAAPREPSPVKAPWASLEAAHSGVSSTRADQKKLLLRKAENPHGGEPWLQVLDAAGTVIGAVDMASVAEVTREAERRTNVLLEGAQEAFRRIAAVEAKMSALPQGKGVRRRAKSADAVAPGKGADVVCYTCREKGHFARACPRNTGKTKPDF